MLEIFQWIKTLGREGPAWMRSVSFLGLWVLVIVTFLSPKLLSVELREERTKDQYVRAPGLIVATVVSNQHFEWRTDTNGNWKIPLATTVPLLPIRLEVENKDRHPTDAPQLLEVVVDGWRLWFNSHVTIFFSGSGAERKYVIRHDVPFEGLIRKARSALSPVSGAFAQSPAARPAPSLPKSEPEFVKKLQGIFDKEFKREFDYTRQIDIRPLFAANPKSELFIRADIESATGYAIPNEAWSAFATYAEIEAHLISRYRIRQIAPEVSNSRSVFELKKNYQSLGIEKQQEVQRAIGERSFQQLRF